MGARPSNGLNAVVDAKCGVEKPLYSLTTLIGSVQDYLSTNSPSVNLGGATYTLDSGATVTAGILWIGKVKTPAEFYLYDNTNGYDLPGAWNYTQLVTPGRVKRSPGVTHNFSLNGTKVLDTTFGYQPVYPTVYSADDSKSVEGDSPDDGFERSLISAQGLDNFVTYMLYPPPGDGSTFVPLNNFDWHWQYSVSLDSGGTWSLSNANATKSTIRNFPEHPIWHNNVAKGKYTPDIP